MKLRFTWIPDSDFGEITDTASAHGGRMGLDGIDGIDRRQD
jgi:hypothetical protein